jgi:hypothetical protein
VREAKGVGSGVKGRPGRAGGSKDARRRDLVAVTIQPVQTYSQDNTPDLNPFVATETSDALQTGARPLEC